MAENEGVQRALRAAAEVAGRLGAGVVEPRLLADLNNVSIRLEPLPVVARVFAVGRFRADVAALGRELAIAHHLAGKNAPIVRPVADLPAGPHVCGDLAVTLWEFTPHRPATERDSNQAAAAIVAIHTALVDFRGPLPALEAKFAEVRAMLEEPTAMPALAAADRALLLNAHDRIMARLAVLAPRQRLVHGDAHLGNVLMTEGGARWTDFEAACLAPAEWDLALLSEADPAVIGPIDPEVARTMSDLRSLGVAAWCWARYDQPDRREAAAYHLDRLKERGAAGFR
jgi:Ser/Thr protein kinase RdoA (MazF antagonist)